MDNTIGGFLTLSIQRMMGTIIGGGLSIIVMTVTRAIFPVWSWKAIVLLCTLMFCQVFIIAKFKLRPNMNYAGGIVSTCYSCPMTCNWSTLHLGSADDCHHPAIWISWLNTWPLVRQCKACPLESNGSSDWYCYRHASILFLSIPSLDYFA